MTAQEVYLAYLGVCPPVYVYHFLKSSLRKNRKCAVLVSLMLFWAEEKARLHFHTNLSDIESIPQFFALVLIST